MLNSLRRSPSLYNLLGEEIRTLADERRELGHHSISWDGKDDFGSSVPSGVYVYRIEVSPPDFSDVDFTGVRKMTLLR